MHTSLLWTVLTGGLRPVSLGLVSFSVFLTRVSLFVMGLVILCFCVLSVCCLVVSTSTINCNERPIQEVTYNVLNGTSNSTHSLTVDISHVMSRSRKWWKWFGKRGYEVWRLSDLEADLFGRQGRSSWWRYEKSPCQ